MNQYQANPNIEDHFSIKSHVRNGGVLIGVYDGHSGDGVSKFCKEELLDYIEYYKEKGETERVIDKRPFIDADAHYLGLSLQGERDGKAGACLSVSYIKDDEIHTANAGDCRVLVGRRIKRTKKLNENDLHGLSEKEREEIKKEIEKETDRGHHEALLNYLTTTSQTGRIGNLRPDLIDRDYKWQCIELTTDHQIDSNYMERERLLSNHRGETDIIYHNRIKGMLQPTRGMGDGYYKIMTKKPKNIASFSNNSMANPWNLPYSTCEVDITRYRMNEEDAFLVIASDGLFTDMNNQQVVEYVGEWLQMREKVEGIKVNKGEIERQDGVERGDTKKGERIEKEEKGETGFLSKLSSYLPSSLSTPSSNYPEYNPNPSSYLIQKSLLHSSEYVIGRYPNNLINLSYILSLSPNKKRNIHDDITVGVVLLDPPNNDNLPDLPLSKSMPVSPSSDSRSSPSLSPSLSNPNDYILTPPPTYQRAKELGIKTMPDWALNRLPHNDSTTPIKIPIEIEDPKPRPHKSKL
jgi:serine/threonine protein phosphatase PrpC